MKLVLFLLYIFSTSTYAMNCLNMSGIYQTSDGVTYQIDQKNCVKMKVKDPNQEQEITFNLGPIILGSEIILEEGIEVGVKKYYLDSFIGLDEWIYKEREISFFHSGSKLEVEKKICVVQKELNRDLFTNCYNFENQNVTQYTDKWLGSLL